MTGGRMAASLGTAKGALEVIAHLEQIIERLRAADSDPVDASELLELQGELEMAQRALGVLTRLARDRIEALSSVTGAVSADG